MAKVWGVQEFAQGDHWWFGAATSGGIISPPDSDSFDGSDLTTPAWYAGGSDGTRHFHVAIDSTGQWWVSVFDRDMTTLIDRWEIPGWVSQ